MDNEGIESFFKNSYHLSFRDQQYLNFNSLNENNIMEYFSYSPFFEKNSINQLCSIQNLDFNKQKYKEVGIEFNLESVSKDKELYLITKSHRRYEESKLISYYYIFKGSVYQAPDIYSVITSNLESITNNFVNIITELNMQEK